MNDLYFIHLRNNFPFTERNQRKLDLDIHAVKLKTALM